MAIFGTFDDIPPDEVLGLIRNKEGILDIEGNIKIFVKNGYIVGIRMKDRVLDTRGHYLAVFTELIENRKSRFKFEKQHVDELGERVPVDLILIESAVKRDEMDSMAVNINTVDPDVPFIIRRGAESKINNILGRMGNHELYTFLRDSYPMLKEGVTAREISKKLGFPLYWVRYMLAVLRAMKVVSVRRQNKSNEVLEALKSAYRGFRAIMRRFSKDG